MFVCVSRELLTHVLSLPIHLTSNYVHWLRMFTITAMFTYTPIMQSIIATIFHSYPRSLLKWNFEFYFSYSNKYLVEVWTLEFLMQLHSNIKFSHIIQYFPPDTALFCTRNIRTTWRRFISIYTQLIYRSTY